LDEERLQAHNGNSLTPARTRQAAADRENGVSFSRTISLRAATSQSFGNSDSQTGGSR
jgi:hypothetical protein